jgi:hypothetical protein
LIVSSFTSTNSAGNDAVRTERQRRGPLLRAPRGDDDLPRAAGAGRDHGHEPDRPGTEDEHALPDREAAHADAVHRDG